MTGRWTTESVTACSRARHWAKMLPLAILTLSAAAPLSGVAEPSAGSAGARPAIARIDPPESGFYAKRLDYEGVVIKAPTNVVDEALYAAWDRLALMLGDLPGVRANLRAAGAELHIIGRDQVTTDLPEWRQDKGKPLDEYHGLTRDQRTRGMGGLLASCGEENLLRLEQDRYRGRDICVHEFAHNILDHGASAAVQTKVREQHRRSLDRDHWTGSYAASNPGEFFAELSMWYFGTHGDLAMKGAKPANGPDGLKAYDPEAFALMDEFYRGRLEPAGGESRLVVRPEDTGEALVNPGMGWTLHFYSNLIENYGSKLDPSDTLDDWPGLSVIYLRVPWSFLEPKEGEFNWSLLDTPAQRWIGRGRQIALRVSCSESWIRYATPKWVQDAGAKGIDFEFGQGPRPDGPLWDPDYLDPVFLEKLDHFLAAMARRYDGNPNVAFIDVGSFGMWGEGHTGFSSRLNEEQTLAVVKRHLDLHQRHFPHTLLCISDDVAGSSKPGRHFPAMDYALSKGVTMRDDSILVEPPPRSWYHAEMAREFWPRLPVILEHEHYGSSKQRGAWSGELLAKSVEDYHASYMSIHWWPREEFGENRETVAKINRRLGYRLQLREIGWPSEVALGQSFTVDTIWANAGVAPCYVGGFWALTLKDEKGGIVSVNVDEDFDVRNLEVGPPGEAPVAKRQSRFTIALRHGDPRGAHAPPTKPGRYEVFVSVGLRDGTPKIALPIAGDDGLRRYQLGRMVLQEGTEP